MQAIAHEELSGAGGRRRQPIAANELTPKEDQVAKLAAQGLTNAKIAQALFLSAKTVDHHLSRAYAKLGVGSRRELMLGRNDRETSDGSGQSEVHDAGLRATTSSD